MASYQGTYASIVAQVIQTLRLDETDDAAQVGEAVNLAYQECVQVTGCLQTSATATLTSGSASYALPAAVAWIQLLTITYADGTFSDPLRQITLAEMLDLRRASVANGQAVVQPLYAVVGLDRLELWPTPGAGQTAVFWYTYLPDELENDADEPVIQEPYGSKLLTYGALVELARFKKDPLLPDFEASYDKWLRRFQVWLNRREGMAPMRFRVQGANRPIRLADRSADTGW